MHDVAWRGMWICVRSKDAQKQLARTSLSVQGHHNNPLTPKAFCPKRIFGHFGDFFRLDKGQISYSIYSKMHLHHDVMPFFPLASRFTTFFSSGTPRSPNFEFWTKLTHFFRLLSFLPFLFLLFLSFCYSD